MEPASSNRQKHFQAHAPAAFTPGKDPVPIVQEDGLGSRAGLEARKISFSPGFDP